MKSGQDKKITDQNQGMGKTIPPAFDAVLIFFLQRNESEREVKTFYDFYSENNWTNIRGSKVQDWKVKAVDWIWKKNHRG